MNAPSGMLACAESHKTSTHHPADGGLPDMPGLLCGCLANLRAVIVCITGCLREISPDCTVQW